MTDAPPFEAGWAAPDTAAQPGIGGTLRARPEDFLVEEMPLYQPSGTGEHVYLFVQKQAMSTLDMVGVLARHFGVTKRDIGYAGLKDKRAITRQVVSVRLPGREVEEIPMLRDDRLAILWVDKHENKLRRGHLRGNRFSIKIRDVGFQAALPAQQALERMAREGMPNRIGPQRFGMLGNNHLVGRAIVLTRWEEALQHLLGPSETNPDAQPESRASFAAGRYADAFAEMPGSLGVERVALRALADGATPEQAIRSIERSAVSFFVTSFQSAVFNAVLTAREAAGTLGTLTEGDVAYMHSSQRTFAVGPDELADPEMPARLAAQEVSPSGPMWGTRMRKAGGGVGRLELDALRASGVDEGAIEHFAEIGGEIEGARKPLRVPVTSPEVEGGADEHGMYVRCAFDLPRGAFATSVMASIMGDPSAEEPESD